MHSVPQPHRLFLCMKKTQGFHPVSGVSEPALPHMSQDTYLK